MTCSRFGLASAGNSQIAFRMGFWSGAPGLGRTETSNVPSPFASLRGKHDGSGPVLSPARHRINFLWWGAFDLADDRALAGLRPKAFAEAKHDLDLGLGVHFEVIEDRNAAHAGANVLEGGVALHRRPGPPGQCDGIVSPTPLARGLGHLSAGGQAQHGPAAERDGLQAERGRFPAGPARVAPGSPDRRFPPGARSGHRVPPATPGRETRSASARPCLSGIAPRQPG